MFSPQTLTELEAHGLTQAHLAALLRFLQCGRNGSFAWHAKLGRLEVCEMRMTYPARPATMAGVTQIICDEGDEGDEAD